AERSRSVVAGGVLRRQQLALHGLDRLRRHQRTLPRGGATGAHRSRTSRHGVVDAHPRDTTTPPADRRYAGWTDTGNDSRGVIVDGTAVALSTERVQELTSREERRFLEARTRSREMWKEAEVHMPRGVPSSFQ